MRPLLALSLLTACSAWERPEPRAPLPLPVSAVVQRKPTRPSPPAIHIEVTPPRAGRPSQRCPPEMVLVAGRICLDRFESSLVEVLPDGATRPWSPHRGPSEVTARAVAIEGVIPQAHISGEQAQQACKAAGKRLCSNVEWVRACRGPDDTTYPHGPTRREGLCNDDGRGSHPLAEVTRRYGLDPERMWYESMNHPGINQLRDTLEPTGAHRDCRSGYGAYDMVGNLHEWTDDPDGTFRGGFFMDTMINGEGCEYATTAHGRDYRDYSTGFRCCAEPVE